MRIKRLCADEIPQRLMTRFTSCVATTNLNLDEKNDILRNHLLAFLQFVEYFEEAITPDSYPLNEDHRKQIITTTTVARLDIR